jgi:metal-dependent amidase/aminoacylase/carboxypeptidase family protein
MSEEIENTIDEEIVEEQVGEEETIQENSDEITVTDEQLDEIADTAIRRIKEICENTAKSWGGRFEYVEHTYDPKVVNNRIINERVIAAAIAVVGKENVTNTNRPDKEKNMGGEDFSFFSRLKPACMFHTGIRNEEKGCIYGGHTDMYKVDEDVLEPASKVIVRFILDNMDGIEGLKA